MRSTVPWSSKGNRTLRTGGSGWPTLHSYLEVQHDCNEPSRGAQSRLHLLLPCKAKEACLSPDFCRLSKHVCRAQAASRHNDGGSDAEGGRWGEAGFFLLSQLEWICPSGNCPAFESAAKPHMNFFSSFIPCCLSSSTSLPTEVGHEARPTRVPKAGRTGTDLAA